MEVEGEGGVIVRHSVKVKKRLMEI